MARPRKNPAPVPRIHIIDPSNKRVTLDGLTITASLIPYAMNPSQAKPLASYRSRTKDPNWCGRCVRAVRASDRDNAKVKAKKANGRR